MLSNTLMVIALMAGGLRVPVEVSLLSQIEVAAIQNQVDPIAMKQLAICESGIGSIPVENAINAWNKTDPEGGSRGIFQYIPSTFRTTAKQYGLENADITNPQHQIKLTAFLLAQGKWRHWLNCSKKIGIIK